MTNIENGYDWSWMTSLIRTKFLWHIKSDWENISRDIDSWDIGFPYNLPKIEERKESFFTKRSSYKAGNSVADCLVLL